MSIETVAEYDKPLLQATARDFVPLCSIAQRFKRTRRASPERRKRAKFCQKVAKKNDNYPIRIQEPSFLHENERNERKHG